MIVDDDLSILEEMKDFLTASGYEVYPFSDSTEAFEKLENGIIKPSLILLDIKMDKKNGFQFANEMKLHSKIAFIPIIAMTGFYTETEHSMLMKLLGVRHFLIKPFPPEDLIFKISEILKPRKNNRHK